MPERRTLAELFADMPDTVQVRFWVCPIDEHGGWPGPRRDVVTVEWDGEGVAHCTYPRCTFTSLTPPPLGDMPPLYHWSPTVRRKQINRYGLRVAQRPVQHTPGWRAPYVCFAETPSWAWALSGQFAEREHRPGSWDLWQVNVSGKRGEVLESGDDEHRWHEVRVHEQVRKRQMWLVATREITA